MPTEAAAPEEFQRAQSSIEQLSFRKDVTVEPIPSPGGVAPFSFALSADIPHSASGTQAQHGTGRMIVLYDPAAPQSWGGNFRVVIYAQAPLEPEIGLDPFLAQVTWSWLTDALDSRGAKYFQASGTATRILSTGFGDLATETDGSLIELRASWSPTESDLSQHALAWVDVLCMQAGMPPTEDAVSINAKRRERG